MIDTTEWAREALDLLLSITTPPDDATAQHDGQRDPAAPLFSGYPDGNILREVYRR